MDIIDNQDNPAQEKKYYTVKGRFKSNSLNFYGLFVLAFNPSKSLEVHHVIVSTYSNVYELEPHLGWEKFEEFIVNAKWKGNYNPNMTVSIESYLKKLAQEDDTQKEMLYEHIVQYDYDQTDLFLFDMLNRVIHDKNLILETGIQELSDSDFRDARTKSASHDEHKKGNVSDQSGGMVTVPVQLILAPVSGKPIYELKLGDKIMVKIKPDSDRANYYIDLLNLRVENHIKPVPATVVDIKSDGKNDPLEILTDIGSGVFGKCVEEERQVKLRLYDPRIDGPAAVRKKIVVDNNNSGIETFSDSEYSEGFPKVTYLIIALIVLFFALFIAFFMLS